MRARDVFQGSDPQVTKKYYAALAKRGPAGDVAFNLFRAQKSSTRAKRYRGGVRGVGSFSSLAYDVKERSLEQLCQTLEKHGKRLRIRFGWKQDAGAKFDGQPRWVLYVDLPCGQVSFHSPERFRGDDYRGEWDGQHSSEERILEFCDCVFDWGMDGALQLLLPLSFTPVMGKA